MPSPHPPENTTKLLLTAFSSEQRLRECGLSRHHISRLVADGQLVRLRRGRYVHADTHPDLQRAGGLGARLDCVTLLRALGVFIHTPRGFHVQIDAGASRLPPRGPDVVAHWRRSRSEPSALAADLIEALARAFLCQNPRHALATLENARYHRLIDDAGVDAVFALLPRRHRRLRELVEVRAEAGQETLMRLMLRGLGCRVEAQVSIRGVGRVDLVVDGWLIVECDSRAYHAGWESQIRDRRRDLAAAALGYTTVRPVAEDILYRPEEVIRTMKEVLSHPPRRPGLHNSSSPRRARAKRAD